MTYALHHNGMYHLQKLIKKDALLEWIPAETDQEGRSTRMDPCRASRETDDLLDPMDGPNKSLSELGCRHQYHRMCLYNLLKDGKYRSCPLCQTRIPAEVQERAMTFSTQWTAQTSPFLNSVEDTNTTECATCSRTGNTDLVPCVKQGSLQSFKRERLHHEKTS
jgi:hypothetical protein